MKATYEFTKPDELEATVVIQMKVKDFRELIGEWKPQGYQSHRVYNHISDVVRQADKVYYCHTEDKK